MPLWLFALFLNAFSFGSFAAVSESSAELVYCPLTKRLQPVKAPQRQIHKNPLDEICADNRTKNSFLNEIFSSKNLPSANHLNDREFENLVFDFSRTGKAAFKNLPLPADFPHQNLVKNFSAVAGFSKTDELKFVWKLSASDFSFAENPRPPTKVSTNFFNPQTFRELEKISRRRVPRAPPFSL